MHQKLFYLLVSGSFITDRKDMLIEVISMNIQNDLAQSFFNTTRNTARLGEHVEEIKEPFGSRK